LNEIKTIGSFIVCNSTHGLCSHDFSDEQISELESFLGIKLTTGTVNLGSTQVKSGLAVNDHGFIIGELSGGPEIINVDEALGFLGGE
jgi:translation initiation factor 6